MGVGEDTLVPDLAPSSADATWPHADGRRQAGPWPGAGGAGGEGGPGAPLTCSLSWTSVSMTMAWHFHSQIILQKSSTVCASGPWVAMK